MKRERLEELRARVFADCQEWDVKCSQDGFQEATPTGEMDADGKDLTALIDAEITRQSVTDEAVQRAIEWAEQERKHSFRYMDFGDADSAALAIQALRQYQKPTGEAVSLCSTCIGCECEPELGETVKNCKAYVKREPTDAETQQAICNLEIMATNLMGHVQDGNKLAVAQVKALDAGIAALRQMKPSKWIPVSERLPEPISQTSGANIKNTYLVARYENCNPKGYFYGYQLARYWKSGWSGIDGSYGLSVTHWMPLPKPPESEINNERFLELCKQYGFAVQQDSQSPGIFLRQKDGTLREVTCFPPENEGCK